MPRHAPCTAELEPSAALLSAAPRAHRSPRHVVSRARCRRRKHERAICTSLSLLASAPWADECLRGLLGAAHAPQGCSDGHRGRRSRDAPDALSAPAPLGANHHLGRHAGWSPPG
eukprot:5635677-Prymnesium_polylepis.1